MKKHPAGIFLFISVVICLAGCSLPIGSIYENDANMLDDEGRMFLIPRRVMYVIDDRFKRLEDFQLFLVENGEVIPIPTDRGIEVDITQNVGNPTTEYTVPNITIEHPFHAIGRHQVTVRVTEQSGYDPRRGYYSIEVFSLNNGSGGGDGDGIGIIWLE